MTETKTYTGSCHCGQVSYRAKASLSPVISCNCSICTKTGALWHFIPADDFTLEDNSGDLVDYQFNKHVIHHLFCPRCGVESFASGKAPNGAETIALNVRCLDDIDLAAVALTPFDGRKK